MTRLVGSLAGIAPLLFVVVLWQVLVPDGSNALFLFSKPSAIVAAAGRLAETGTFWGDLGASAGVLIVGYSLGALLGWVIGLLIWFGGKRGGVAELYLLAIGSAPIFAMAPLLIFLLGTGAVTRIVVVGVSVLIPMALSAYSAARSTERTFQSLIEALGTSRTEQLRRIVAPGCFYQSLPSLKSLANVALVGVFLSEWISAQRGLAKFVLASMSVYDVADMWVGLFTFMLMGAGFSGVVNRIERRATGWRSFWN